MKKIRQIVSLFLAFLLSFSSLLSGVPTVEAATRDVITGINVTKTDGTPINPWDTVRVTADFALPNDGSVQPGDTTTLKLPEKMLMMNVVNIPLEYNGVHIGDLTFDQGTQTATIKYSDGVTKMSDIKGAFFFDMRVDHDGNFDPKAMPMDFNVDFGGSNKIINGGTLNYIGKPAPHPLKFYKNGYFDDPENNPRIITYSITINQQMDEMHNVVYFDNTRIPGEIKNIKVLEGTWEVTPHDREFNLLNTTERSDLVPTVNKAPNGEQSFEVNIGHIPAGKGFRILYEIELPYEPDPGEVFDNTGGIRDATGEVEKRVESVTFEKAGAVIEGNVFKIILKKVDKNDPNKVLPGAKFDVIRNKTGLVVGQIVTGPDGIGRIENLLRNDYTIKEVEAPAGYKISTTPIQVTGGQFDSVTKEVNLTAENEQEAAKPTKAQIKAKKELTGRALVDGEFSFVLKDQGGQAIGAPVTNANGEVVFPEIEYTQEGTYTYTIEEVNNGLVGITYAAPITVTVEVTKDAASNTLLATVKETEEQRTFKNVYTPAGATSAVIAGFKHLEGKNIEAGKYEFELVDVATGTVIEKVTNDASGNFKFTAINYDETQVGVHKYQVREVEGTEPGVTYDKTVFDVEVDVKKDNATNTLSATVSKTATDLTFNNKYVPAGTTVVVTANKALTGRALNADEFEFILKDETGTEVARAKNAADGTITFSALAFDKAGVFNYTVEEVAGNKGGVTYDAVAKPVVITVTDDGSGQLAAAMTSAPAQFNNTYKPAPVDVRVKLTKELTGRGLNDGEFEFVLKDEAGNEIERAKNAADGSVTFQALTFDTVGVYNYTVEEVAGSLGGVTYDTEPKAFTVTVTDDLEGKLVATVNPDAVVVKNTYKPAPVQFGFKGSKELVGRKLKGGEFEFVLKDANGTEVARTTNTGSGEIEFNGLTVDQPGTYKYTIEEVNNNLGGVTYDTSVKEVEVTVTDNGKGQLVAEVKGNKFVFKNLYESNGVEVEFELKKELLGRQLKDGEFEFVLKDKDGKELARSKNNAEGVITFKLEYAKVGTYRYTVEEVKGDDSDIVYDESVKEIEIEITDNGEGQLDAVARAVAGGTTFTNRFEPPVPNTDKPKAELPKTGEMASYSVALIGLVMLAGSLLYFRRREA